MQTNRRGRDRITRTGQPKRRRRERPVPRQFLRATAKRAASFKIAALSAGKDIERADGLLRQSVAALARGLKAERGDERRLVAIGVLAGAFAERRFIGFDIENIVGDLKRRAERLAIARQRRAVPLHRRGRRSRRPRPHNAAARRSSSIAA